MQILTKDYQLGYTKIRDVISPERGTKGSAGIDLYVPNEPGLEERLEPGERCVIPSGIKFRIPEGYALIAFNKSGISVKHGLQVGAQVIDSDYTGEVHINLFNNSNETVELNPGDKVVQLLLVPIAHCALYEVDKEETLYENFETERGEGKFGSTNN